MHVLLIKISSMGDLIHTLPALTDAKKLAPDVKFDWVIEESFAEIGFWHPSVNQVIKSAHRRWRKQFFQSLYYGDLKRFCKNLRAKKYDFILDAQSSIKSALIASFAKGPKWGLDRYSVREYAAHFAYQKKFNVTRKQHASEVIRHLFAKAFGYTHPNTIANFGIDLSPLQSTLSIDLPHVYYVFVHTASWKSKCWPENFWRVLIQKADEENRSVLLPWGTGAEKERAQRIAKNLPNALVLPKMSLTDLAKIIEKAKGAITVDTGLGHLCAALGICSISLHGPTDPFLVGSIGKNHKHLQATFPCSPCNKAKCLYKGTSDVWPACFTSLNPEKVWQNFQSLQKVL